MSSAVSQSTVQPSPASVAVAAGTTPRAALEAAGVELTGPSGAVVVRDSAGRAARPGRRRSPPTDEVEPVAMDSPDGLAVLRHSTAHVMAQAVQDAVPGHPARASGRRSRTASTTTSCPAGRSPRKTSAAIEKKMTEIVKAAQRFSRREIGDDEARGRAGAREVQAGADRAQGRRGQRRQSHPHRAGRRGGVPGRRRRADHVRQPQPRRRAGLDRPLPRPAPAHHPADPGVQADAHRRGVLARRPEQRAAAADLRHRLGEQGRPEGLPDPAGGGGQARSPQARRRTGPVQLSRRARLRPGRVPSQGRRCCAARWRTTSGSGTSRRASTSSTPRTSARTACSTPPATCRTTPTPCSRRWSWRTASTGSRR